MPYNPVAATLGVALSDAITVRNCSIKSDGSAIVSPSNGGLLVSGYDTANVLQRLIRVNASGQLIVVIGSAGATASFDTGSADETITVGMIRSAVTALDNSLVAATQNQPVEARAALAAQAYARYRLLTDAVVRGDDSATYSAIGARSALAAQAYTIVRLATDAVFRADDGATYSVPGTRAALAAQAYTLQRLLVDGVMRGDDGATYTAVGVRASGASVQATSLQRLLTDSALRVVDSSLTTQYQAVWGDAMNAISGRTATVNPFTVYTAALITGNDTTGVQTLRLVETRGALTAQAYTLQRVFSDSVIRGDDSATYSAIGARSALAAQAYTIVRLATDAVFRADDGATYSVPGTRAALAAQAYTLQRLLGDAVIRGDDGATYTAISTRGNQATKNSLFPRAANGLSVNARGPVASQAVTATDISGNGVTATLAAPGVSLRQYITRIQIIRFAAAALTAAATPVLVTTGGTAGIPGSPIFSIDASAAAQGTTDKTDLDFQNAPIEASADNGTVTIVAPATTGVIWRINVWYYNG